MPWARAEGLSLSGDNGCRCLLEYCVWHGTVVGSEDSAMYLIDLIPLSTAKFSRWFCHGSLMLFMSQNFLASGRVRERSPLPVRVGGR